MRIDFKKPKIEKSNFFKFCEKNGANFFETDEEYGVWIIPKKYGEYLIAIRLNKNGKANLVRINESCMNIDTGLYGDYLYAEEQEWIIQTLTLFKKYKPMKGGED